jgi:uncharacterized protein (DUF362 family)
MNRRGFLGLLGSAALARAKEAPAAPVAIARCRSYNEDLAALLGGMFDQLGGLGRLVKGKTITVKVNLTGSPGLRFMGRPLGDTHYVHPKIVEAFVHLLERAGAARIRLVESCWGTSGPMEEYLLDCGWPLRRLQSAARNLEFENTNALGKSKRYSRLKVPDGYLFGAFDLNHSYEATDIFMTLGKLKQHATCGVTLSLKNCFGLTPASIYGDDAGYDEPNESPEKGRAKVLHYGIRRPSKSAPQELDPGSSRAPGYRVPRIVADLVAARPTHLALIDGVHTIAGGEGPWIEGVRPVSPGLLIAGTNPVCTDAVAMAAMSYDPEAGLGTPPFNNCDNTLALAEARGVGTADLRRIEVRGLSIRESIYRF